MAQEHNHIISTIVENKPGVLYTVSNLFRRRGFNIDNISVGPAEDFGLARMTTLRRMCFRWFRRVRV